MGVTGVPRWVYLSYMPPYVPGWDTSLCTPPYVPGWDTSLCTPLCTRVVYPAVYTYYVPGWYTLLYIPYYTVLGTPATHTVSHDQGVRCARCTGGEALGSVLRIIRDMRRIELLLFPKV